MVGMARESTNNITTDSFSAASTFCSLHQQIPTVIYKVKQFYGCRINVIAKRLNALKERLPSAYQFKRFEEVKS